MIKKIRLLIVLSIIQLLTNSYAMGKSMQIDEPFYKVHFKAEGVIFGIVVNGFEAYSNNEGGPVTLEIPINQFVKSGKNKLELQLHTWEDNDQLSISDSAYINVEYRLYTSLKDYVVLNKLVYSAKDDKQGSPFKSSSKKGQYSLVDHKLVTDNTGEYVISDLEHAVDKANYDANYIYHIVTMPTPFPEWRFLKGDIIAGPDQFKSVEKMMDDLIRAPYSEVEKIHEALSQKDIDSIMPLFKERNDEMDKAYYYKSGTYENLLRDAIEENFKKNLILGDLIIDEAQPVVSPGKTTLKLGDDSILYFHNDSKSVYKIYEIYFRKEGDKWIITR